jgi:hypothetical protein
MHHVENALRDFMNVERHSRRSSVIVFDDMLPRDVDEAARDRHTTFWTGDVHKLVTALRRYRPDLTVVEVDSAPTGVAVTPDPQAVPDPVLVRKHAVRPEALLRADFWPALVRARNPRLPRGPRPAARADRGAERLSG